jgi:hypothetical protein
MGVQELRSVYGFVDGFALHAGASQEPDRLCIWDGQALRHQMTSHRPGM